MYPKWPPKQAIIPLKTNLLTLNNLKQILSTALEFQNFENISVFKFFPLRVVWLEINLNNTTQFMNIKNNKKKLVGTVVNNGNSNISNAKRIDNVLLSPFFVKEGDLFCLVDNNLINQNNSEKSVLSIALPENTYYKELKQERKSKKLNYNEDFISKNKKMYSEVALSIGVDFDFSDEESS
jgi:hypothetical protein